MDQGAVGVFPSPPVPIPPAELGSERHDGMYRRAGPADDRKRRDGDQEVVAVEASARCNEAFEVRPVQQREPHRRNTKLVQRQG